MYKIIERIGFVILMIGFILILVERFVDSGFIHTLSEIWQIFFWGGMALWAVGYAQREKEQNDN